MILHLFVAVNVSARQAILENSIGAYPEETFVYQKILALVIGYPLLLILATFVQFYCYQMYNGSKHPFKKLVKRNEKIVRFELKSLLEENDEYTDKRVSRTFNAFVEATNGALQMPKPEPELPCQVGGQAMDLTPPLILNRHSPTLSPSPSPDPSVISLSVYDSAKEELSIESIPGKK